MKSNRLDQSTDWITWDYRVQCLIHRNSYSLTTQLDDHSYIEWIGSRKISSKMSFLSLKRM